MHRLVLLLALLSPGFAAAQWVDLLNGKDLEGWEIEGESVWTVMRDGTLVGQHDVIKSKPDLSWTKEQYNRWMYRQSWLYTKKDFDEFDLHLEYWLRRGGNSGISIRDASRAKYATAEMPDFSRTPARIAYEIQLANHYPDKQPSGSIYNFVTAKAVQQVDDDWNSLDLEVRANLIRVRVNGTVVAEYVGDPGRPKRGPIGLQLHDQNTVAMFRNIRIREIPAAR